MVHCPGHSIADTAGTLVEPELALVRTDMAGWFQGVHSSGVLEESLMASVVDSSNIPEIGSGCTLVAPLGTGLHMHQPHLVAGSHLGLHR